MAQNPGNRGSFVDGNGERIQNSVSEELGAGSGLFSGRYSPVILRDKGGDIMRCRNCGREDTGDTYCSGGHLFETDDTAFIKSTRILMKPSEIGILPDQLSGRARVNFRRIESRFECNLVMKIDKTEIQLEVTGSDKLEVSGAIVACRNLVDIVRSKEEKPSAANSFQPRYSDYGTLPDERPPITFDIISPNCAPKSSIIFQGISSTISRDSTQGSDARKKALLADFGLKLKGIRG